MAVYSWGPVALLLLAAACVSVIGQQLSGEADGQHLNLEDFRWNPLGRDHVSLPSDLSQRHQQQQQQSGDLAHLDLEQFRWNPLGMDRMLLTGDDWESPQQQQQQQQQQQAADPSSMLLDFMTHSNEPGTDPASTGFSTDEPFSGSQEMPTPAETPTSEETSKSGSSHSYSDIYSDAHTDSYDEVTSHPADVVADSMETASAPADLADSDPEPAQSASSNQRNAHLGALLSQMLKLKQPPAIAAAGSNAAQVSSSTEPETSSSSSSSSSSEEDSSNLALENAGTDSSKTLDDSVPDPKDVIWTGEGNSIDLQAARRPSQDAPKQFADASVALTVAPTDAAPTAAAAAETLPPSAADLQTTALEAAPTTVAAAQVPADTEAPAQPAAAPANAAFEETNLHPSEHTSSEQEDNSDQEDNTVHLEFEPADEDTSSEAVEPDTSGSPSTNTLTSSQLSADSPAGFIPTSPRKSYEQSMYEAGQTVRPSDIGTLQKSAAGLITARRTAATSSVEASAAPKSPGLAAGAIVGIVVGSVIAAVLVGYVVMTARARMVENANASNCSDSRHIDIETAESYTHSHSNPSSPATSRRSRLAETSYAHAGDSYVIDGMNASPTRGPCRATNLPFSKLHKGS